MNAVQGKPGSHLGEIENPDGVGEHGSIACGDALRFTFRVERNEEDPTKDVIVAAKYLTFGCTSAIAASEALCCIVESRRVTPIEALSITNEEIVHFLEGLPQQKIHCSVMGAEALTAAVFDWARRRGVALDALGIESHTEEEDKGRMVCKCFGMSEPYIKRKIKELNLHTIPEITGAIKAGGACGSCHHAPGGLQDLLNEVWGTGKAEPTSAANGFPTLAMATPNTGGNEPEKELQAPTSPLSPYQKAKKIEQVIESYIKPLLQKDGGSLEIVDIKDNVVYVELSGACAHCAGATQTLKHLVEKSLKAHIDDAIRVVQV
ncbi:MAG: iron-sulfur cluster assembly scaffold protein [Planctomycetia bacterium]|nr:iron-sulfur cluster assembly scaffold protein [Planctomycetia bacterium]